MAFIIAAVRQSCSQRAGSPFHLFAAPPAASARSNLTQHRPSTTSHDNQLDTAAAAVWKRLARENTSQTSSSELLSDSPSYHLSSSASVDMFSLTDSGNRSTPRAPASPALVLPEQRNGRIESAPASMFIRSLTACSGSLTATGRTIPAPAPASGDGVDVSGDIVKSTAHSDMYSASTELTPPAKHHRHHHHHHVLCWKLTHAT